MKVKLAELRALGWTWPPHELIEAATGDTVDLAATRARLAASQAFHQRERDAQYAFAAKWRAPIDDITDRGEEVSLAIHDHSNAIAAVDAIAAAMAATPPQRKPAPTRFVYPQPTAAEVAAHAEHARIPVRDELRALLATYLDGELTEAMIDRVDLALRDDRSLAADFRNISQGVLALRDHRGQLWVEQLWDGERGRASGRVLAVYAAVTLEDCPPPRPYCPAPLAGTWQLTAPYRARVELGANGELAVSELADVPLPDYETQYTVARDRWAVEVFERGDSLVGDRLTLYGEHSSTGLRIDRRTADRVELSRNGLHGLVRYVFDRLA